MARKVPASPAHAEAALDAALAQAPRPALPPGLTARIVAQATALPQLPADSVAAPEEAAPRVSAKVIPFQTAPAAPAETPQPVKGRGGRWAGGFAALAATVAAVVMLGQSGQRMVPTTAPAPALAQRQDAPARVQVVPASVPDTRLAAAPAPASNSRAPATAAVAGTLSAEPAPSAAPAVASAPEAQLAATVAPAPRESAGPTSDPSPRPQPRGLMGPPAPQQGWAFGGGTGGGGSLPGGQSLPSQTTGTAPPPPPPPGH